MRQKRKNSKILLLISRTLIKIANPAILKNFIINELKKYDPVALYTIHDEHSYEFIHLIASTMGIPVRRIFHVRKKCRRYNAADLFLQDFVETKRTEIEDISNIVQDKIGSCLVAFDKVRHLSARHKKVVLSLLNKESKDSIIFLRCPERKVKKINMRDQFRNILIEYTMDLLDGEADVSEYIKSLNLEAKEEWDETVNAFIATMNKKGLYIITESEAEQMDGMLSLLRSQREEMEEPHAS